MYDIVAQLQKDAVKQIMNQVEEEIKKRLASIGFTFNSKEDFYEFSRRRLTRIVLDSQINEIYLDYGTPEQKLITYWRDVFTCSFSEENRKVTATITYNGQLQP